MKATDFWKAVRNMAEACKTGFEFGCDGSPCKREQMFHDHGECEGCPGDSTFSPVAVEGVTKAELEEIRMIAIAKFTDASDTAEIKLNGKETS